MNTPAPRLSRRRFLRASFASGFGACAGGTGLSLFGERNRPRVYPVSVRIRGLPAALEGLRIAQISDLHRSLVVSESYLRRCAELATSLQPDVIAVTGDFVSDSARLAGSCGEALAALRAPLGVYGVLGNHDHWSGDPDAVTDAMERGGMRMLTNRSVRLTHRGEEWWLCGVDDPWAGTPDPQTALRDVPDRAFRMLLAHAPDYADEAALYGFPLQLSGHSHGGQCILPNGKPLVSPEHGRKYPIGLRRVENSTMQVYTNVGVGVILPPIRMNCPPEVTLMTLKRA